MHAKTTRLLALLAVVVSLALPSAGCGDSPQPSTVVATSDLSVGVFAECELPTPLRPILDSLGQALGGHGIEISGEAILVYDHDLACGGNTLELLLGGGAAWSLGDALGLGQSEIQGFLNEFGATAGLLATATVGLDFNGNWDGIQFGLDGYAGGDVFGVGGGRWKILWSTDKSEVGEEGFWASISVASDGACSAGGVAFGSDKDVSVLKQAWDTLTGQSGASHMDGGACGAMDGGASSHADSGSSGETDGGTQGNADGGGGGETDGASSADNDGGGSGDLDGGSSGDGGLDDTDGGR